MQKKKERRKKLQNRRVKIKPCTNVLTNLNFYIKYIAKKNKKENKQKSANLYDQGTGWQLAHSRTDTGSKDYS